MMRAPATVVEHGGKQYELYLTTTAMLRLESRNRFGLVELTERLAMVSLQTIIDVFWAARLHAEPKLKPDDVVKDIVPNDIRGLADALNTELAAYFRNHEEAETEDGGDGAEEGDAENPPPATD